jgi:aldehyde:ferredoxin oxidoreductase
MEDYCELINAACEGDWDMERFNETGERIWNIERVFNIRAGLRKADDTLPKRILQEPATSGTAEGQVCRLDEMLPSYYELRGWDSEGMPTEATMTRLGLL